MVVVVVVIVKTDRFAHAGRCSTIQEFACNTSGFATFCKVIQATQLEQALEGPFQLTVFAPDDQAFDNFPQDIQFNHLLKKENRTTLTNIVLFHAVEQKLFSRDLRCTQLLTMANGRQSRTVCRGNKKFQKGAGNLDNQRPEIISTNIVVCNGLVHVVNQVMLPPSLSIFPKDDDRPCSNIGDLICNTDNLSDLCRALKAAQLDLNRRGPYTIFAPTNEAFENLPHGTFNSLLLDLPTLTNILSFHLADKKKALLWPNDLECTQLVRMANGNNSRTVCRQNLVFQKGAGNPSTKMPQITVRNLPACNGVVHVVDQVLLAAPLPQNTRPDTSPPIIVSVRANPNVVDSSSSSNRSMTITVYATDDLSGIDDTSRDTQVVFRPPVARAGLLPPFSVPCGLDFAPGNGLTNPLEAELVALCTLPQDLSVGQWSVLVSVADNIGNMGPILWDGIFTVTPIDEQDDEPPMIVSASANPNSVNTFASSQNVTVTVVATDNLSGIGNLGAEARVILRSLNGASVSCDLDFAPGSRTMDPLMNVQLVATCTFSQFSETGNRSALVIVVDNAGNVGSATFDAIVAITSESDDDPPKILAAYAEPDIVDTSQSPVQVQITVSATDDLSGIDNRNVDTRVVLQSPTDSVAVHCNLDFATTSGGGEMSMDTLNTELVAPCTFPQSSETGAWSALILISDLAGNVARLTIDEILIVSSTKDRY